MASLLSPAAGPGYHGALWGCLCDLRQAELQTDSEDVILSITKLSPDDGVGVGGDTNHFKRPGGMIPKTQLLDRKQTGEGEIGPCSFISIFP